MMFSTTKLFLLAALFTSVLGHAAVATTKEDAAKIQRNDVVQGDLDSCPSYKGPGAGAVVRVSPQGTVTLFAHHFGNGKDGSTYFNAAMSNSAGQAGSFQNPLEFVQNGELTPKESEGIATLVVKIPGGIPCRNANCMLALRSNGGFGNCVRLESEFETTPTDDDGDASSASTDDAPNSTTADEPAPTSDKPVAEKPASDSDSDEPAATNAPVEKPTPAPASKSAASAKCMRKPAPQKVKRLHVRDWFLGRERFAHRA